MRVNLRFIELGLSIGTQSTIGIDTLLSDIDTRGLGEAQAGLSLLADFPLQSGIASIRSAVPERSLSC